MRTFAIELSQTLRRSFVSALRHDCLNLSQSAAYSAMVALFPALIVLGTAVSLMPDVTPLRVALGDFFDQVLPSDVFPLLNSYFSGPPRALHLTRVLTLACFVTVSGGSSVIATLMEGLRRAETLPRATWTFWQRRLRAVVLVPLSLLPLAVATILVVFGHFIAQWLVAYVSPELQSVFFRAALGARWIVAFAGVAAVTALIYHMGMPKALDDDDRNSWHRVLPGALVATIMWFATTLVFGWYVTRFANYNQVYGSLGAGVALLFWLFLVFLSVLCGAEFNAHFHKRRGERVAADTSRDVEDALVPAPNPLG